MADGPATTTAPSERALMAARDRLALRMVELREAARLSQREAARRGGLDQRNWSRIEAGGLYPRLDSLLRIQHALSLESLETLLGESPSRALLSAVQPPLNEPEAGEGDTPD